MIRLFKLGFSLVLLLVLLVVADRLSARVAAQVVADKIKSSQRLATTPTVSIGGFPFLTQLLDGTYSEVDAKASDIARDNVRAKSLDLHLYGVHLNASDVVAQSVKEIRVDRASGTVVLSYADINALAKPQGIRVSVGTDGLITVAGSVKVAGQVIKGSGIGSVSAVPAGVKITVSEVRTSGLPSAVTSLLVKKLSFLIPNSSLPYGVTVKAVRADATGVTVTASSGPFTIRVP